MTKPTRWAHIFIATVLFAVGVALCAPAAPAQDQAWFITRAVYGFRSQQNDVTDLVRDMIARGGVKGRVAVNNQTMGGDPAVGADKTLRIFAKNRAGQERRFDFAEGTFIPVQMFVIPDRDSEHRDDRDQFRGPDDDGQNIDRDHHDGDRDRDRHRNLQILWGFYGVQRQTANVTPLLQQMVDDGRLSVAVNNRSMGGDPAPGADKVLIVVYRFDGAEQAAAVPEGGLLSIP